MTTTAWYNQPLKDDSMGYRPTAKLFGHYYPEWYRVLKNATLGLYQWGKDLTAPMMPLEIECLPSTTSKFKPLEAVSPTSKPSITSAASLNCSDEALEMAGLRENIPTSAKTLQEQPSYALTLRNRTEKLILETVKKDQGDLSRAAYYEVVAEATHITSRFINSIAGSYGHEYAMRRPQDVVKWTKANVPPLSSITYLGSETHPQTGYKRARVGGITPYELDTYKQDFLYYYGREHGSQAAQYAFDVLCNGVQHNMRWEPENSVVPMLQTHYHIDAHSKVYALAVQNGDTRLLGAALTA